MSREDAAAKTPWFRSPVVLAIVVAVIGAAVFLPSLTGSWVYDDHPLIPNNPFVHSFRWWPRWFLTDFWDVNEEVVRFGSRIVYWRPAITASYAADWQLGGGSPVMFHVTNTLAQAAVGVLVFAVLRRWIGAVIPAALAALLFVVHPTKAESVAWIAGRTDVFCMVAILVTTQGAAWRLQGRRGGLALEIFGTAAAYMCKEQAIVLPVFVGIECWIAAGRPAIGLRVLRRLILGALPQAMVAVVYIAIRSIVMPIRAANVDNSIGFADHVQAVLETIGRFLALTFAPHDLSIQQGLVRVTSGQAIHSMPYMLLGGLGLVALVAAMVVARRRWPVATIGIAFFLITLAPTSNIIYTDMMTLVSERFLYLPVLGFALIAGAALTHVPPRWGYTVIGVLIAATAAQAVDRSADYRDERKFWARELALHPISPIAQQFEINEALREKRNERALRLTLEMTKRTLGLPEASVAVQVAEIMALLVPDRDTASLRAIDAFLEQLLDPDAASASIALRRLSFSTPIQSRAFQSKLHKLWPRAVAVRVDIRSRLGDDAGAVAMAERELRGCPRCVSAVMMTALARARAGDYDGAIALLDEAGNYGPGELYATIREMVDRAKAVRERSATASGPMKLQAQASELAAVELWGRAYDVLAPYKEEIAKAPKFVVGFAELAFRAGDTETAREVLTRIESPEQVEAHLASWSQTMGWAD